MKNSAATLKRLRLAMAIGAVMSAGSALAQDVDHSTMDHSTMHHPAPQESPVDEAETAQEVAAASVQAAEAMDHATHVHADALPHPTANDAANAEAVDHSQMDHAVPGSGHGAVEAVEQPPAPSTHVGHSGMDHSAMDHSKMDRSEMDHSGMDHSKMDHSEVDHSGMDHSKMDHSGVDHSGMDNSGMDHSGMDNSEVDHSKMDHSTMDHSQMEDSSSNRSSMDHSTMDHSSMDHSGPADSSMEHSSDAAAHGSPGAASGLPREPIPVLTDADRRAAFPELAPHPAHGDSVHSYFLANRLEAWDGDHGTGLAWEAQAWIGKDTRRLWIRSEGERSGGGTEAADLELLYGRSISPWWEAVAGVRHDFKPGDSQSHLAIGVMGLAPQWFEIEATAYLSEHGRLSARIEAEYEMLLTNRLILQPLVEASFQGGSDPSRGIGSGLGTVEAGLRLRYEVTRRFAPYIGLVRERAFGDTADFRRQSGEAVDDTHVVAGLRIWF